MTAPDQELQRKLWQAKQLRRDTWYHTRIGPLDLWVKRFPGDWYVAHQRETDRSRVKPQPAPLHQAQTLTRVNSITWNRWVAGEQSNSIRLVPAMPDHSLVIRPRYPLNVPRGQEVLFFVNIPVWVRLLVGLPDEVQLCELPTVVLSKTWFGDPVTGELCYSLKTKAPRRLEMVENHAYMAVCPVLVRNQAATDLDFQRICIRVEHLNVYRGETRLWTNQVEVLFHGEDQTSQIITRRRAPEFDEAAEMVCEAREPAQPSLLKKSFFFLKALSGI